MKWEHIAWCFYIFNLIWTIRILHFGFLSFVFQPWKKLRQNYLTWKPNMMKKLLPSKSLAGFLQPHVVGQVSPDFANPQKISTALPSCQLFRVTRELERAWPLSCYKEYSVIPISCSHQFNAPDVTGILGAHRAILPAETFFLNYSEAWSTLCLFLRELGEVSF